MALLGDTARPGGVTFAFTERSGGVSKPPFASLNLGSRCGDDPKAVAQNRTLALKALGAEGCAERLVEPKQVHGDTIVSVLGADESELKAARARAQNGADAIVCTASNVPVLLCFADCVPVVLCAPGAFAIAHSGWRGTLARISAKTATVLMDAAGVGPEEISVYIGPHILGADYEVSPELIDTFTAEFGTIAQAEGNKHHLDMSACIYASLAKVGIAVSQICDSCPSTATNTDRFYSYRAEKGQCGRHAAIAFMAEPALD